MRRLRKLGMRIRQLVLFRVYIMLWPNGLAIRNSSEIMLCFVKNVLQRFMFSTFSTLNDVERFQNWSLIHEFYSCNASQNMCKVHTSHEVTNAPHVRANDENATTTVTADLTINYDVEKNTSLAEKKSRMLVNTTSLVALTTANWILKDTDRSNLNSKVKYLSLALTLNIWFLLLVFIGFNTFKVQCGIAHLVTTTIVQALLLYKQW